jgi:hypothetical protein
MTWDPPWDTTPRTQGGIFSGIRKILVLPVVRCDRCFEIWAREPHIAKSLDAFAVKARAELARRAAERGK